MVAAAAFPVNPAKEAKAAIYGETLTDDFINNGSSTPTWATLPVEQPLPPLAKEGYVDHEGARIWHATAGKGEPIILLHGGMASSLSCGNKAPALIKTHHEVMFIDSRRHGRSTLGPYPLSYERMQSDVAAVMDTLYPKKASFVGWSDGANISLIMAMKNSGRVKSVYAFGANMNTDAIVPGTFTSHIVSEAAARLAKLDARISLTPDGFNTLHQVLEPMQKKEPNYTTKELGAIKVSKIETRKYHGHFRFLIQKHLGRQHRHAGAPHFSTCFSRKVIHSPALTFSICCGILVDERPLLCQVAA
jgi:pimeloyl-ACP methyl ester carboxylesterase